MLFPSFEKETLEMATSWPSKFYSNLPVKLSHIFIVQSHDPETIYLPSDE